MTTTEHFDAARTLARASRSHVPDVDWAGADARQLRGVDADEAGRAGIRAVEQATSQEPEITRTVIAAASAAGVSCIDLENRVESPLSVAARICIEQETAAAVHTGQRETAADIVAGMTGILRYTVVEPEHARLAHTTVQIIRSLQEHGWSMSEVAHSYHDGSAYKSISATGTAPTGGQAQVEIHSADSLAVIELSRAAYETYRASERTPHERLAAKAECQSAATLIVSPEGLDRIKAIGGTNVSIRRYS